jgi:hypothetical protein
VRSRAEGRASGHGAPSRLAATLFVFENAAEHTFTPTFTPLSLRSFFFFSQTGASLSLSLSRLFF